jgi:predicted solute-binding protein
LSERLQTLKLAISTCPNDTFAFHAILNRKIDLQGLDFQIELLDIQQLNLGLKCGQFDLAKASFYAALQISDATIVLPSGAALGFGVGPLLLAAEENTSPSNGLRYKIPGASMRLKNMSTQPSPSTSPAATPAVIACVPFDPV